MPGLDLILAQTKGQKVEHILVGLKEYLLYCFYLLSILVNGLINVLNDDRLIGAVGGLGVVATSAAACIHAYRKIKQR